MINDGWNNSQIGTIGFSNLRTPVHACHDFRKAKHIELGSKGYCAANPSSTHVHVCIDGWVGGWVKEFECEEDSNISNCKPVQCKERLACMHIRNQTTSN